MKRYTDGYEYMIEDPTGEFYSVHDVEPLIKAAEEALDELVLYLHANRVNLFAQRNDDALLNKIVALEMALRPRK